MLLLAAGLFALHYRHLEADFPNGSPWMDWSKYTDEGWYGDGAIRLMQRGHWYVEGDFNPAVALPVFPVLESAVFRVFGVSLVSARAFSVSLFGLTLCAAGWVVWRRRAGEQARDALDGLAAAAAVLMLAASPFCYVFTRLAILEPLMVLEMLLALVALERVRLPAVPPGSLLARAWAEVRANRLPLVAVALLLPVLVLTKTTALFLVPALAYRLFAAVGHRFLPFLRVGLPVAATSGALWLLYFLGLVRPHYLLDYRYLFSANAYTGITRDTFFQVVSDTFTDGMWMGNVLYPAAVVAMLLGLGYGLSGRQRLRRNPLVGTLVLWALGYAAFLAYHDNLQPRYYLVVAVPLTLLVPVVLADCVVRPLLGWRVAGAVAALAAGAVVLLIVLPDARQTLGYVRHPEYTFLRAAREVAGTIRAGEQADPTHNPLVLSISGSDLSLITGLPSICDDFGTLELEDRVAKYRPGWYVAWNQLDDDKMDAMTPLFHIERVAAFPAFDDADRNLMIVYRLDPAPPEPPPNPRRKRKPIPRKLVTRVGQQPSPEQLQH